MIASSGTAAAAVRCAENRTGGVRQLEVLELYHRDSQTKQRISRYIYLVDKKLTAIKITDFFKMGHSWHLFLIFSSFQ